VPTPGAGGAGGTLGAGATPGAGGTVGIFGESGAGAAMVGAGAAGESLAILGSLAPGELRVELEYRLPALADAPARFARRLSERIPLLEIYLVDTGDLAPRSKLLHRRRPAREGATNYLRLEAYEVAPGEEVALTVERLPPRSAVSQGAALAAAWALALGAVAVLLGPFRPLRRAGAESAEGAAHGAAQAAGAARALREEAARAALREEREALYAAIGDLDHDLETGKLSAADHAELRAELRARAIHLLREERDAAEGSAEGGVTAKADATANNATAPRCAACGFEAAQAHRFCAHCGAPLSAPQPDSAAAPGRTAQ